MPTEAIAVTPEPSPALSLEVVPDPPAGSVAEIAAGVTGALVGAWNAIRAQHPDVPEAVITMATGGRESARKLAHFEPRRWRLREGDDVHHEVFVTAESLQGGAEEVFSHLLHEAVHAVCEARGVDDCSASQYHNKKFRDAAAELGLRQKGDVSAYFKKKYGFAGTEPTEETAAAYAEQVMALDEAIRATRVPSFFATRTRGDGAGGGVAGDDNAASDYDDQDEDEIPTVKEKEDRNYAKATCGCTPPTVIRVSPRTLSRKNIMCADCTTVFTRDDTA
ncbi:hypothetical protein CUT44_14145 [Streptomyces carminius]|uniref:SprT-like domain-containing protein n=1 Tax=Streptomyces carminius TaxID=2665496 RepID=A0A2M8LYX2_9ACTN|nr:hypothetical protein [Streptomyces carminius]PJE97119.1 hypothetical protein CUT44_14145 [Streptomyces carminius]